MFDLRNKKFALIDMDGVLYDSMPYHTLSWQRMITELGLSCTREEFYLYEGMTGRDTIDVIFQRELGRRADPEEARRLYERKARYFVEYGPREMMPGADRMIRALMDAGIGRVLVTGSAQSALLDRLDRDYSGAFPHDKRVTAHNVARGKPFPDPYLKGLQLSGVHPEEAFVIENAPLGVRAAKAAGLDTIAVTTGPIPRENFIAEGADEIFPSMPAFADFLTSELNEFSAD